MKFSILQMDLVYALNIVKDSIPTRSTISILSNVVFDVTDKDIVLKGTDLENIAITSLNTAQIEQAGMTTVNAADLLNMLKTLSPKQDVVLNLINEWLHITCGKFKGKLPVLSYEEFPQVPQVENNEFIEIPGTKLADIFSKVGFSVSSNEYKPALSGICLKIGNKDITFVSTDSHRLSLCEYACNTSTFKEIKAKKEKEIIISGKGAGIFKKLLASYKENIEFGFFDMNAYIKTPNFTIISRLVMHSGFPNYKAIIPDRSNSNIKINSELLKQSIKQVNTVSDSKASNKVNFLLEKNKLTLHATGSGEASTELEIENSDELTLFLNAKYVLDILDEYSEDLVFDFGTPVVITPAEQAEYQYIIMPMRE